MSPCRPQRPAYQEAERSGLSVRALRQSIMTLWRSSLPVCFMDELVRYRYPPPTFGNLLLAKVIEDIGAAVGS